MRRIVGWAAAVLLLASAAPGMAQTAFTGGTGVVPTQVQNVPITPGLPVAAPQTAQTGFGLSSAFSRNALPSAQPTIGTSTFPSASALPSTGYLQAFGYQPAPPQPSAFVRFRHWLFGM